MNMTVRKAIIKYQNIRSSNQLSEVPEVNNLFKLNKNLI